MRYLIRFNLMAVILLLVGQPLLAAEDSISSPLAVIVAPELEVDDISYDDLQKILFGDKKSWAPRKPITILLQAPLTSQRNYLISQHMGMTEPQFKQHWISKVFRAEVASGPKVILSNEMAVNLVTKIPGSIAFIEFDVVPDNVKVLTIDGKTPDDPAYQLKP